MTRVSKHQPRPKTTKRASRRLQHLPIVPDPSYYDGNVLHLPLEIKSLVASFAPKWELKQLRLVTGEWQAAATPFLFNRIFISPRERDMDVFVKIKHQPSLASCVRQLRYDTASFESKSYEEYQQSWYQYMDSISFIWPRKKCFPSPCPWLNEYISGDFKGDEEELFREHYRDDLILQGYDRWQEASQEEEDNNSNTVCGPDLALAFRRLPCLGSVVLDDNVWCNGGGRSFLPVQTLAMLEPAFGRDHLGLSSGSPHARSWNLLHCRPAKSSSATFTALMVLMETLSAAGTTPSIFDTRSRFIGNGLPPWPFRIYGCDSLMAKETISALWRLEKFCVQITPMEEFFMTPLDQAQTEPGYLPKILGSMPCLKRLNICLLSEKRLRKLGSFHQSQYEDTLYIFRQIFPTGVMWPKLEQFKMEGLGIDGYEMYHLVIGQMPALQHLSLHRIDLLNNSRWESLCWLLKWSRRFEWNTLRLEGSFRHGNNLEWWPECADQGSYEEVRFLNDMRDYIIDGGRHPGLPADAKDADELDFYDQLLSRPGFERELDIFRRSRRGKIVYMPNIY